MGAVAAAPLQMLSSFLGTCAGSCITAGCFKLAESGTVSTTKAVFCVLAWLQVLGLVLAVWANSASTDWLGVLCEKLSFAGQGELGVCGCIRTAEEGAVVPCWQKQLTYRATAASTTVFLFLLVLAVSGCASDAARLHIVGKYLALLLLWACSLALPNTWFEGFGAVATVAASVFLLVQSVFAIDLAYRWNEAWHDFAVEAKRNLNQKREQMWYVALLVAALVLLACAVAWDVALWKTAVEHRLVLGVAVLSLATLVLSITAWCEHGSLLTSAAMAFYGAWLLHEALGASCAPGADTSSGGDVAERASRRVKLLACMVYVAALGLGLVGASPTKVAGSSGKEGEEALLSAAKEDAAQAPSTQDNKGFALQCAAHAAVPLYACAALVPRQVQTGCLAFQCYAAVAVACPLLYGWSLVAPMVLKSRRF